MKEEIATAGAPEIACTQILQKETSVLSVQWTIVPAALAQGMTPESLLNRYLDHIRRFTLGAVRPVLTENGVEFRLFGSGPALLRFQGPAPLPEGGVTLAICGGVLVERASCDRGELTFACEDVPGGTRVLLRLSDYCPLLLGPAPSPWRKGLYRLTQASIHRLVTVRFLVRLQRELAGSRICCRIVRIPGKDGEDI